MKNNIIIKVGAVLVALAAIISLSGCQANSYTGPTDAPKVVVASSESPTSDLLTDYRRSITVGSGSDLYDTFVNADALAESSGAQLVAVVFSQDWYDGITVPSGMTRPNAAANYVTAYLNDTGSAFRICNSVFIDSSITSTARTAIYNAVTGFVDGSGSPEPGAAYQYRTYTADPGNELLTYADACYGEGV